MTALEPTRKRQRIYFSGGYWWLSDPERDRNFRLDPEIAQCGWNVSRLCENLGLGKRTFSRMVDEGLGVSSKRWLREIRITAACHLLREECKIEVVAQALGFRHLSDFTREFKKMVGVSPSRYMKAELSRSTGYRPAS
ncbi:MAG: AraC family transcriptional regulator [Luteolibacter sp.]